MNTNDKIKRLTKCEIIKCKHTYNNKIISEGLLIPYKYCPECGKNLLMENGDTDVHE